MGTSKVSILDDYIPSAVDMNVGSQDLTVKDGQGTKTSVIESISNIINQRSTVRKP